MMPRLYKHLWMDSDIEAFRDQVRRYLENEMVPQLDGWRKQGFIPREAWQAFMGNGLIRFLSFLFIVSLCWHAWVGVRDIWMDYLNSAALRLFLHVMTLLALVGYAGWAIQIIWRL